MVQMVFDGVTTSEDMWTAAESWWLTPSGTNSDYFRDYMFASGADYYAMFAFTKAMRLANPAEVVLLGGTFDWYGDPTDGLARRLVDRQNANGSWSGGNRSSSITSPLSTPWSILILGKTLFDPGAPVAVAEAVPNPGVEGGTITLDGSGSFHRDPTFTIDSWDWDLNGDGDCDDASGERVTTSFEDLGSYDVTLCVTDDGDPEKSDETTIVVQITLPPIGPTADADGPYVFCPQNQPWLLDGSGSINPDEGLSEEERPGDTIPDPEGYAWDLDGYASVDDAFGPQPDVTDFFTALGPGEYLIQLRVTDTTATSFPSSEMGNLSDTDSAEVRVHAATDGACIVHEYGWGEDVALQEGSLYAYVAFGEAGVRVYDVSNPAVPPVLVNTEVPEPGDCPVRTDEYPDFYADGLKIVEAEDMPFGSDVAIFAAGACGIIAADISDPMDLETLFVFDTPSWAEAVDVFIDDRVYIYVASFWGGLRIFGQTNPDRDPEAFGELGTWGVDDDAIGPAIDLGVELRGDMILAHVLTDPSGEGMAIVGNRAFLALWRGGILVLDISDPTDPDRAEVGRPNPIPTERAIYSVTASDDGTWLWATEGDEGVRTFWIDGGSFDEQRRIPVADGTWAWEAAERDGFLYVSYGVWEEPPTGGLLVFPPGRGDRIQAGAAASSLARAFACGLGFELVFALPPLLWLRSRRARARRA
jgi:hypothetical protein